MSCNLNKDLVLLPSATRTALNPPIAPIMNETGSGIIVVADVTALVGYAGFDMFVLGRDIASGENYGLARLKVDAIGKWVIHVGAGVSTISTSAVPETTTVFVAQGLLLPRIVTVLIERFDDDAITYSVGANLIGT